MEQFPESWRGHWEASRFEKHRKRFKHIHTIELRNETMRQAVNSNGSWKSKWRKKQFEFGFYCFQSRRTFAKESLHWFKKKATWHFPNKSAMKETIGIGIRKTSATSCEANVVLHCQPLVDRSENNPNRKTKSFRKPFDANMETPLFERFCLGGRRHYVLAT